VKGYQPKAGPKNPKPPQGGTALRTVDNDAAQPHDVPAVFCGRCNRRVSIRFEFRTDTSPQALITFTSANDGHRLLIEGRPRGVALLSVDRLSCPHSKG